MANSLLQLKAAAELELRHRQDPKGNHTVVGFVSAETHKLLYCMSNEEGEWQLSFDEPDVYLAEKLARVLTSTKRFIVIIGGRGSSKSVGIADICIVDAKDSDAKVYCLREFQSSIKSSVLSLLKEEITRLEFEDDLQTTKTAIQKNGEDLFEFAGLARNIDSIKSAHGFKRFFIEEAQFLSQDSLDTLTPTARNKPKKGLPSITDPEDLSDLESDVSQVFVANPGSAEDPFSKRFIVPFQDVLDRDGYYEDELHLVVVMNYHDNPWFMESGLEEERQWAYKTLHRELYDHIWLGKYNDSVENSLILAEWFDACVDAHLKLNWDVRGAKIASFDPSDVGPDPKSYVLRHANVFVECDLYTEGDANEGARWATGRAIQDGAEFFTWDCDGLGAALNEQVSNAFVEKDVRIEQFKGSETPDFPDTVYQPAVKAPVGNQVLIKDAIRNKRAQYYVELRDRVYRTYRAVVHKEFHDPDKMISFSSKMTMINKLRSEVCRMPIKLRSDGLIELYTKKELRDKFKFASPNLGDGAMMNLRYFSIHRQIHHIPKPLGTMQFGRRPR